MLDMKNFWMILTVYDEDEEGKHIYSEDFIPNYDKFILKKYKAYYEDLRKTVQIR